MKYILFRLKRFCGFLAGFVFFIAGVLKLLDPVGTGLIMKEYFDFLHIGFLAPVAKPAGAFTAFLETILGAALVTGTWRKVTAAAALIFQGFFTILTLFLLIFNPEMDCGCFGEAIHLTHAQTFIKNLILMAMLSAFAFPFKHLGGPKKHKYVSFGIVTVSVLAFAVYSWSYIPLVDYTAFRPAVALQAGNAFETAHEDMFGAVFVYEKDGKSKEFTLDELPDSTWNFVETKTTMKEGFDDSIVNLSFRGSDGEYADSLAARGKVMIVSVYDTDINPSRWNRIARFVSDADAAGFKALVLVSDTPELPSGLEYLRRSIYLSDYKTLITMNRSNGGATYFSDGYLICKWAFRDMPDAAELDETRNGDDTEIIIGNDTASSLVFQAFMLYIFAVMLLL